MEKETVNQETATSIEDGATEKIFTQAELDQIISDRLKRERDKYTDYEALKEKAQKFDQIEEDAKTELQKATERAEKLEAELSAMRHTEEVRTIREKVAQATGVPMNLLSGETEEDCTAQAKAILDFKSTQGYPLIKDSGEIQKTVKGSTRQQFADWAEKALK